MTDQMQITSQQSKMKTGRRQASELKKRLGLPSPLKSIRLHCLSCVCGSASEVRKCEIKSCPLWHYRFGRSPREEDIRDE